MTTLPNISSMTTGVSVEPSYLEGLGKQASRLSDTAGLSMTEAVVHTLGREKLNSEQIRRVVEFANVDAYNRKYASMSPEGARVVHIDGGPADPAQVIQELSASHQAEAPMHADYASPPTAPKVAHVPFFRESYRTPDGAMRDIAGLRSKIAADHSLLVEDTAASQYSMNQSLLELMGVVKTCALEGVSAEELYAAWHNVHPELAKVAYSRARTLVPDTGVKVAGRALNPQHKVVTKFAEFARVAEKYASQVEARHEAESELARVDTWLQERQYVA